MGGGVKKAFFMNWLMFRIPADVKEEEKTPEEKMDTKGWVCCVLKYSVCLPGYFSL